MQAPTQLVFLWPHRQRTAHGTAGTFALSVCMLWPCASALQGCVHAAGVGNAKSLRQQVKQANIKLKVALAEAEALGKQL